MTSTDKHTHVHALQRKVAEPIAVMLLGNVDAEVEEEGPDAACQEGRRNGAIVGLLPRRQPLLPGLTGERRGATLVPVEWSGRGPRRAVAAQTGGGGGSGCRLAEGG
jgi:hypothetical protein